jgi:hypothetical protein
MGLGPTRRRRPEDVMADTGDIGDLSATAMPTGTEGLELGGPMPGTAPAGAEAMGGNPMAAAMGPPTSGPTLGQDLAGSIVNPGDVAMGADLGLEGEEAIADGMASVLDNPEASPEERNEVLAQLGLAARRRLGGI